MCALINTKIGLPGPSTVPPKLGNLGHFLSSFPDPFPLRRRRDVKKEQMHTLLTMFMSTVMLVCEDVWLSGMGQEFTEVEAWTRPVC